MEALHDCSQNVKGDSFWSQPLWTLLLNIILEVLKKLWQEKKQDYKGDVVTSDIDRTKIFKKKK